MVATTALPRSGNSSPPRTVLVGAMFASGASMMVYFGLLGIYAHRRAEASFSGQGWFPEGTVELGPPGFIFWTLVLSVFTVQWAVQAIKNGDRTNAMWAMAITALFGAAVFNQLWFIINDIGYALADGEAEFFFFVVNGTFIVFLILAVVFLALTMLRALFGSYGPRQSDGIAAAAMFWNTVVAMWSITWYVIYITK